MVNLTTFMVMATAMLLGVNALDESTANRIKEELIKAKIIPEVIEEFEPLTKLKITYDEHKDLDNGEHLKPEETLVAPSIWFDPPKKDTEYTLAMVNLDSNGRLVRHWIATNVKGGDAKGTAFLSQLPNRQYTSYKGPTPPAGSDNHRVAFILYEQQAINQAFVPEIDGRTTRDRAFFNLTQFAQENNLKPISAAYFYTEYQEGFSQQYPPVNDDISEEIHKSGLVNDILDDVGNILGIDNDTNEPKDSRGKPNNGDNDNDNGGINIDVNLLNGASASASTSGSAVKRSADLKQAGFIDDLLDGIGLDINLNIGHGDDGNDDKHKPPTGKPNNGDNHEDAAKPSVDMKQAGLIDDLLNGLGLGININVGHRNDDNDDDEDANIDLNPLQVASVSVSASASAAKPSVDMKQAGLIDDLLNGLGIGIDLNIGHRDDDNDDKQRPPNKKPNNGDNDEDANIDLNLLQVASASVSASASAAKPSVDMKQAGLIDDLLNALGIGIDLNIGNRDGDNDDKQRSPNKKPNNVDKDEDANIDLNLLQVASASVSASASAAKPSVNMKQAGLIDDLLNGLGIGIDLNIGHRDDKQRPPNRKPNNGDNDEDANIDLNLLQVASASVSASASAAEPSTDLKQAELLSDVIDDLGNMLDIEINIGHNKNDDDNGHHRNSNSKDTIVGKVGSNLNRAYPPLLAAHVAESVSAAAPKASTPAVADLKQAGILDSLIKTIGHLIGIHREVDQGERDIISGDLVIKNNVIVEAAVASPSSSSAEDVEFTDGLLAELKNGEYDVQIEAALKSLVDGA